MRRAGTRGPVRALTLLFVILFSSVVVTGLIVTRVSGQNATVTGVGPWTQQNNYASSSTSPGSGGIGILGVSCVAYSGYVYCVGGQNATGTDISDVFYAQLSSTGSVGAWSETTDYGAVSGKSGAGGIGAEWPSCVEYNGYIYCVAGAIPQGLTSKVFYAQLSSSGVGPWTETTDFGAASGVTGAGGTVTFQLACVVDSGYVYCVGYNTSKVFFAKLLSSGVGPWTETTDYGASSGNSGSGGVAISSTACVDSAGYIYCVGGTVSFKPVSDVFYAPVELFGCWRLDGNYRLWGSFRFQRERW